MSSSERIQRLFRLVPLAAPLMAAARRGGDKGDEVRERRGGRPAGVRPMTAPLKALVLALAIGLGGCGGGSNATAPDPAPPTDEPGTPDPSPGVPGSYLLERINESKPGQLVTIANPDGKVIGLYRFEATTLVMDALQTFVMGLRYTDDKTDDGIDDEGEFKQAGPVSQEGALPLTFSSGVYGDSFTGVVLGDFVAIKYDFDGDGQPDTSFGFRRQQITLPAVERDR